MSYDITFVYAAPGTDALAEVRRRSQLEDPESDEPAPSEADHVRRRALVADLLALHPTLRMVPNPKLGFERGCSIGGDDGCPFPDIHLGVWEADVCVPYSNHPSVLHSLDALCAVFARHGYIAYDPQTDDLFSVEEAIRQFGGTQAAVREALTARGEKIIYPASEAPKRPWWRFW